MGDLNLIQIKQCFAHRMFRLEDLQAYMMRLFLEYAVSSLLPKSLSKLTTYIEDSSGCRGGYGRSTLVNTFADPFLQDYIDGNELIEDDLPPELQNGDESTPAITDLLDLPDEPDEESGQASSISVNDPDVTGQAEFPAWGSENIETEDVSQQPLVLPIWSLEDRTFERRPVND